MLDTKCIHHHSFRPLHKTQFGLWLSRKRKKKMGSQWWVIHMLSFDGIWAHIIYQCHKYISYSIFKNTWNSLGTKFWLLYKFVTATLKVSCNVFSYIPNVQDPKDRHSSHTLKSENPFSIRTLAGQLLHPDVPEEGSSEPGCAFRQAFLTKHAKAVENTGLYASPTAPSCLKTHTFRNHTCLTSTILVGWTKSEAD